MDYFDGIFLEENSDKTDNNVPPSESKSELDLSVENVSSTQPTSTKSVKCQKRSDGILALHPPSFSKNGKVKDRISNDNMMGITRDDKVNIDKVKYTIPSKRYAKPFKERLSSQILHLVPMENHQNFFKGNYPKWPKDKDWNSNERVNSQHKVYLFFDKFSEPVGRYKVRHASEMTPP
jgi:hypothetical protein